MCEIAPGSWSVWCACDVCFKGCPGDKVPSAALPVHAILPRQHTWWNHHTVHVARVWRIILSVNLFVLMIVSWSSGVFAGMALVKKNQFSSLGGDSMASVITIGEQL